MNRILVLILSFLTITTVYSATDKSKYCPLMNQIYFRESRLVGINSNQKQFLSGPPCSYDCGPDDMKVLSFLPDLTTYDQISKTLACAYKVKISNRGEPDRIKLMELHNHGDY